MRPMSDRTVVLVHGAWHGAWCWAKQQAALAGQGVASIAVDLPGHGDSDLPLGDLHGDADHLAGVLTGIDGEVVLVGHSYGGAVITEAAAAAPNVAHLVYLTAFCPDRGETVSGLAGSTDSPGDLGAAIRVGDDGNLSLDPEKAVPALYGDCTPEDVAVALARLGPQPLATFTQEARAAGWIGHRSTYVVCTEDRAIPVVLQRTMAARCTESVELRASHSPFLSMPDTVAWILAGLATS